MVHPKVKILSFIHPHDFPNLYEFLLLNIKKDILKNVGTQIAAAAIDFHSHYFFHTMEINGYQQMFNYRCLILFCIQWKKETLTGLEQPEDK